MKRFATRLIGPVVILAAMCPTAFGDVFVLSTGGQVVGELLNPAESPRTRYIIKTVAGGQITLNAAQVKQVLSGDGVDVQYERIRPGYADSVDGQWALAEWCREHRLSQQRKTHLQRVIELDADHAPARHALGYSLQGGKWRIREEVMQQRGFVRYEGSWKTSQEIKLLQQRRQLTKAQGEWFKKLRRWTRSLEGSKDADARRGIRTIEDPSAVKGMIACLDDNRPQVRILLIETMAKIGSPEAVSQLMACSLEDPNEEVRMTCVDYLKTTDAMDLLPYYVGALGSSDNATINRAAVVLSHLGRREAVGPLITALVSTHKQKISGGGGQGSISPTFGTGPNGAPGGGGLSVGGKPKIVKFQVRNQAVLDALVSLTGTNFAFQPQDWRQWLVSQRNTQATNLRRD